MVRNNARGGGGSVPHPRPGGLQRFQAGLIFVTKQLAYENGPNGAGGGSRGDKTRLSICCGSWTSRRGLRQPPYMRRLGEPQDVAGAVVFYVRSRPPG